ncbi:MAG: hypothetical protein SGI77_10585 [Pirellulaceae bacterium]|nr:hypothetical protein [Pirellulaceae bacterium]
MVQEQSTNCMTEEEADRRWETAKQGILELHQAGMLAERMIVSDGLGEVLYVLLTAHEAMWDSAEYQNETRARLKVQLQLTNSQSVQDVPPSDRTSKES